MSTELKTITAYDEFRSEVESAKDNCNFIPDMATDEGYEKSKRVALDAGKILTAVEKTRKELKSESLAYGKMVDSEAKLIVEEIQAFQLPHKDAYKELDNLKKEREANRKAELEERVRVIRELPEAMADSDSEGIKMALESLATEECLDFYEYATPALLARNNSKEALSKMFADKLQSEKDAIELAELRKKQAEQEQKDRDERIAKEASEKADREAADAKAAEQKAIEQAAEAVRQREASEAQAKIDAELAEERRVEAERQAKANTEAAAKAATEEAERVQKEKEDFIASETAKKEANNKHVGKIRGESKDCLIALGVDEKMAKKIILAIHNKDIKNVSISY